MTSKFPTPGDVFEDTYRIEAILGSGGFARVYRAVEQGLERPVALKILRPPTHTRQSDSQRDNYMETLMERFQREAMMLSKLRSSYTVNLYKYGKTEDGLLYMALEFIDGLSLQEILRAGKPLKPKRVVKILQQVLMSLQEAHMLGMLHRDLKPANIMVYEHLGEKDQVKLLDFGIAKLVTEADTDQDLTGDGTLIGTPRYMAPEQIQGTKIGTASDLYALGLVSYELLTGERAIKGDSSIQIIGKQLAPQSFMLPEGDQIPEGLRYIINKMMEKDLNFRYEDCEAVLLDLGRPSVLKIVEEPSSQDIPQLAADVSIETMEDIDLSGLEMVPVDENDEDLRDSGEIIIPDVGDEDFEPLPPAMSTRENLYPTGAGLAPKLLIALIVVVLIGGAIYMSNQGEDPGSPPITKNDKPAPERDELKDRPVDPEIQVTAKLDGVDIEGVTVYVNGVEKGVTPLTLKAAEIRDAKVVASYQMPDREKPIEDTQDVTDPRDVLFEFDKVVTELTHPVPPDEPIVEAPPEVEKPKPKPKPRPRPRPKPRPDPEPNITEDYPAPE